MDCITSSNGPSSTPRSASTASRRSGSDSQGVRTFAELEKTARESAGRHGSSPPSSAVRRKPLVKMSGAGVRGARPLRLGHGSQRAKYRVTPDDRATPSIRGSCRRRAHRFARKGPFLRDAGLARRDPRPTDGVLQAVFGTGAGTSGDPLRRISITPALAIASRGSAPLRPGQFSPCLTYPATWEPGSCARRRNQAPPARDCRHQ